MADGRQWGNVNKAATEGIAKGRAIRKMGLLEKTYRASFPDQPKGLR